MKTFVNMNVLLTLGVFFTLAICVTVDGQQVVIPNNTFKTTETKLENEFSYSETDTNVISSLTNFTVNETLPNMVLEENVCKIQPNGCDRNIGLCYSSVKCSYGAIDCNTVGNLDIMMMIWMKCYGYTNYSESIISSYSGYFKDIFCNVSQLPEVQSCNIKKIGMRTGGGGSFANVVRHFSPSKQVESVPPVSGHFVAITLFTYKMVFPFQFGFILHL